MEESREAKGGEEVKDPEEATEEEKLWIGGITVLTWILWVAFNLAIHHERASTERLMTQRDATIEALRRLP